MVTESWHLVYSLTIQSSTKRNLPHIWTALTIQIVVSLAVKFVSKYHFSSQCISHRDTFLFLHFLNKIIFKLEVSICVIFLHIIYDCLHAYYRITEKGKGLHLQELPIVLVQEIHLALLILNRQLHLFILLVMELLWRATCRMLLVYPRVWWYMVLKEQAVLHLPQTSW